MYLLKGNAPVPTQTLYESTLGPHRTRSCPPQPILHPHRTFSRYHRALTDCDSRGGHGYGYDGDDDDAWKDARRQNSAISYSRRYFHRSSRHYHLAKSGDLNWGNGCDVVHDGGGNALRLSPPCVYRINESAPHENAPLVNRERDVLLVMSLFQHVGTNRTSYRSTYCTQSASSEFMTQKATS